MRDVYVVAAARTAVGKSKRTLAAVRPEDMAGPVLRAVVERAGITADKVQDVVLGCAFPEGEAGMNIARIIAIAAGFPDTVPAMTLNRFCSSGLEAIVGAASKIRCGLLDIAIAGGVESMSMIPMSGNKFAPDPRMTIEHPELYISMGNCGDNVARDFGISREEMDQWAFRSVQRALAAIDAGKFKEQIVPLEVKTPNGTIIFDTDEGPRRDTTLEGLQKLRPAFTGPGKKGFATAGNSSQTSDAAAVVLLMSEEAVKATGAKPMAKVLGYNVAAGDCKYLGPPQLLAIPRACELSGISVADVGLFENNEAFSSQCLLVVRDLKLDPEKVNVNGGAIALGHPLGCTGGKLSTQRIYEMRARGVRYGVVTMCIGGGMGAAGVFELCN
ncbi:MAG: thiolase family protein [Candidatus Hydrogenedentes bacterium]|nr:thiolase family protein [Candidatus Hydrogenedentota bacterium]